MPICNPSPVALAAAPQSSSSLDGICRPEATQPSRHARRPQSPTTLAHYLLGLLLALVALTGFAATLSPTNLTLVTGGTGNIAVTNTRGKVSLTNANPATVSAALVNGTIQVSAKAPGSATLTVKDKSGSTSATVTVLAPMSVAPTAVTVIAGQSTNLTVTNAFQAPTVTTSNSAVATATVAGGSIQVNGVGAGSASLSISDTKTTVAIAVTVQAALGVSPASLTISAGQSAGLSIAGAVGSITVSNSDSSVVSASLSGNAITVQGLKVGQANLTVRDSRMAVAVPVLVTAATGGTTGSFALMAWNDLGMHCMDADYSVFSILPPYNNLHAQLVNASTGKLVTSGVTLTYEAIADPTGSRNSFSSSKTNFWTHVKALFGAEPPPETGLAGNRMPGETPQPLAFDAASNQFKAEGVPITPYDDAGYKNTYPLLKVVAKDSTGKQLATARVVLPVSDEMSCVTCHASRATGSAAEMAAKPKAGWVFDSPADRDYRRNILRLHDEKSAGSGTFASALAAKGYKSSGLLATADSGTPILCAGCHASNALPGTGVTGIAPLTQAMHAKHATAVDPSNNLALNSSTNRAACYQCHPGSETKCLRGAMGAATLADGSLAMQCQSCHGSMSKVGTPGRVGWLDQPNCQGCHHDGQRTLTVASGAVSDTRFATNPNTPSAGFSLFRMSKGHGGLQCEACHGATHAEYPSSHDNDNLLSQDLQGFAGTLHECTTCHKTEPSTIAGGPHGMHPVGQNWVTQHHDQVKGIQSTCTGCHGADYRGTVLSSVKKAKTFNIGDGRSKAYSVGDKAGCYDCHNGPTGG